jgi:light-regulated signal transduction histidine kinase (bacteriophytochrome)
MKANSEEESNIAELKLSNKKLKAENKELQAQILLLSKGNSSIDQNEQLLLEVTERTFELEKKNKNILDSRKALALLMEDVNESRAELKDLNKQLENINEELKAFAFSISHDLRAPLRHIRGFIDLLRLPENYQDQDKVIQYLDIISISSIKMGELIDGLLKFSRIGRTKEVIFRFELNELIKEILDEFSHETEGRNVKFVIDDLPSLEADRNLIKIVFMNLISNAIKFTKNKQTAHIEIGIHNKTKKTTTYFVKDNGAGFNMKYAHKLFGVFQRLHTDEEFEGNGIGLATVQRIINRYNGKIWAESQIEKGSCFYFHF